MVSNEREEFLKKIGGSKGSSSGSIALFCYYKVTD